MSECYRLGREGGREGGCFRDEGTVLRGGVKD